MKVHDEHVIARVLDTTVNLILVRGARGWSMDELAVRSGLSKRTLYKIVGSRDELLECVVLRQMQKGLDVLVGLVAAEADAARALARLTLSAASTVSSFALVGLIRDLERRYPALAVKVQELKRRRTEPVLTILQRGMNKGALRADVEPEFVTQLAFGIIGTCVAEGYRGSDLHRRLTQGFDLLCRGLLADAAALSRYEEALA